MISEHVLGDLHPELLSDLFIIWLVGVLFCHFDIVAFQSNLDSFVKMIEDRIDDNLRLLHHNDLVLELRDVFHVSLGQVVLIRLACLLMKLRRHSLEGETLSVLLLFLLADVESVVHLKIDRVTFRLLYFLALEEPDHSLRVIGLRMEEEGHVVHRF